VSLLYTSIHLLTVSRSSKYSILRFIFTTTNCNIHGWYFGYRPLSRPTEPPVFRRKNLPPSSIGIAKRRTCNGGHIKKNQSINGATGSTIVIFSSPFFPPKDGDKSILQNYVFFSFRRQTMPKLSLLYCWGYLTFIWISQAFITQGKCKRNSELFVPDKNALH